MIIYPAIDLIAGEVVRLHKGDFEQKTAYEIGVRLVGSEMCIRDSMGWNRLVPQGEGRHPLLAGVEDGAHVYFVHSYAAPVSADTVASCSYGVDFTALVARGNFMGAQFHPERSGPVGARILGNFLALPAGGKG